MDKKTLGIISIIFGIIFLIWAYSSFRNAQEGIQTNLFLAWFSVLAGIVALCAGYHEYTTGKLPIISW